MTQPGILTIGVPALTVTGTTGGIAWGGLTTQVRVSFILTFLMSATHAFLTPITLTLSLGINGIPVPLT